MKLYFTFTRARLAAVFLCFLIFIIIAGQFSSVAGTPKYGDTNAHRIEYISSLGYNVDETCEDTKEVVIPTVFSDVYLKYNKLQNEAGFDLTAYKGCKVIRYTYKIIDSEERIDLLVFNGRIIGGDIITYELNGQIKPLK